MKKLRNKIASRIFQFIIYNLTFIIFFSCTNSPNNIPFPNEREFAKPKTIKLGKPEIVKAIPKIIKMGSDSFLLPKEIKLGKPKTVPFVTNEFKLGAPKIVTLGKAAEIKLQDVSYSRQDNQLSFQCFDASA